MLAFLCPNFLLISVLLICNTLSLAAAQIESSVHCPPYPGYFWSNATIDGETTCFNDTANTVVYGFDISGQYFQYTSTRLNGRISRPVPQSVSNFTCLTPISPVWNTSSGEAEDKFTFYDCKSYAYCYLPADSVDTRSIGRECPTNSGTLSSLAVFNAVAVVVSFVFGHDAVRKKIHGILPNITSGNWSLWGGVVNAIVQAIAMVVAARLSVNANYRARLSTLFGLWTMRPRISLGVMFLPHIFESKDYICTQADLLVSESILCIMSAAFAVNFITQYASTTTACLPPFYSLARPHRVHILFFFTAIEGLFGLVVLAIVVVSWSKENDKSQGSYEMANQREWGSYRSSGVKRGKTDLEVSTVASVIGIFNALLSFLTNWLIWAFFVKEAGSMYCPRNVVGTGVTWGVAFVLNGIIRPIASGPS